jgi:hypothetical protein
MRVIVARNGRSRTIDVMKYYNKILYYGDQMVDKSCVAFIAMRLR